MSGVNKITQPGLIDWLIGVDHKVALAPSAGRFCGATFLK